MIDLPTASLADVALLRLQGGRCLLLATEWIVEEPILIGLMTAHLRIVAATASKDR
jgi:hypothetical protein